MMGCHGHFGALLLLIFLTRAFLLRSVFCLQIQNCLSNRKFCHRRRSFFHFFSCKCLIYDYLLVGSLFYQYNLPIIIYSTYSHTPTYINSYQSVNCHTTYSIEFMSELRPILCFFYNTYVIISIASVHISLHRR